MPKFHLLYFKNLLDMSIVKFFELYNKKFQKIHGKYVLSEDMSRIKLSRIFKQLIIEELSKYITKYDRLSPDYYLIIGSCLPKNNLLLDFKNDKYFPAKITKLLNSEYSIKYLLKEKDIDINIMRFNDICIELSNDFFYKDVLVKKCGKDYANVIFVQHNKLDCYVLFKVLKFIYGKSNCINIYKEKMSKEKLPLVAINDIIGKYINKSDMNKSQKLKLITDEIQQYIDEKIKKL